MSLDDNKARQSTGIHNINIIHKNDKSDIYFYKPLVLSFNILLFPAW